MSKIKTKDIEKSTMPRLKGNLTGTKLTLENFLSSGCPKLDEFLRGGFPRKGITQIYGEAGTGKTQLALQMCLTAQIPAENSSVVGGVVYICTEDFFPSKRFQELLVKSPLARKYSLSSDLIFIEHLSTISDLENCLLTSEKLSRLLATRKIKLLVIDSIAAPYRSEYDYEKVQDRAKSMRNIGYQLQKFSYKLDIAIICINQVTAAIDSSVVEHISSTERPSLGITWNSIINNSFYIYRKSNQRFLCTAGSSYLPCRTTGFNIYDYGIAGT